MYKLILSLFSVVLFLGSCSGTKNIEKMTIASEYGDCVGVMPMKCLLIKVNNQANWEFLYAGIEGFEYEPGYEYVLEVKKETIENPAADQSSIKYILVKEVSKVQKTSENLPFTSGSGEIVADTTRVVNVTQP